MLGLKIELVIADRGWILEKIADVIQAQCPSEWQVRIVTNASDWPDLHYYLPYSKQPDNLRGFSVCFMTHLEDVEPAHSNFLLQAKRADYCVSMSEKYTKVIRDSGIQHISTITTGVDLERFDIEVRVGIVGRAYHTGRKGEDLVQKCMDIPNIKFLFTGSGWPGPSVHLTDEEVPDFISSLDYLLVPARIEGGPVPLMEALASGVEVIAPSDVGFVEKFPHIPFKNSSAESLRHVLETLVSKRRALRESVLPFSWETFGREHVELFSRLAAEHDLGCTSENLPEQKFKRIYLVSHGTEGFNKGGPTTRMRFIEKYAIEQGYGVKIISDASSLDGDDTEIAVVHVFNSWPLKSAFKQVSKAKELGYHVIFSPIALNLEYHDFFAGAVPKLLGSNDLAAVTNASIKLRSADDYEKHPLLTPSEGVKDQFKFLEATCSLADGVILLSEYEKRFLERINGNIRASIIIENGIDSKVMASGEPGLFKKTYNLNKYILSVGRIEPRKNQATLAAAVFDLDIPLVLLGHSASDSYLQLVLKLGQGNVIHIDRIDDRAMLASAYRDASLFLMASWVEGAPLAALEASCSGVPMILSNQSSEQEYFSSDALYVNPADINGIRESVLQVISADSIADTNLREKISQRYVSRFSSDLHAERTLNYYSHVFAQQHLNCDSDADVATRYIDVTHWAHSASNGMHPTGVTKIEEVFSNKIISEQANVRFLVWNAPNRTFISLSAVDIKAGLHVRQANARNISEEFAKRTASPKVSLSRIVKKHDTSGNDKRESLEDRIDSVFETIGQTKGGLATILQSYSGFARKLKFLLQYVLGKLVIIPLRLINGSRLRGPMPIRLPPPTVLHDVKFLPNDSASNMTDVPYGSELLLLGQPWISNDKYLSDFAELVQLKGVRVTLMVQDLLYITHPGSHSPAARRVYAERINRMLSLSTKLMVSSAHVERELRQLLRYKNLDRKIERFSYQSLPLVTPLKADSTANLGHPYVMFVSSINKRKNHRFLIEVWHFLKDNGRIPNAKLIFVGKDQTNGGLDDVLSDNVSYAIELKTDVDDADLAQLYSGCVGTVYPSEHEGWGLPIQESVAYGKPCLAGNKCPAAKEINSTLVTRIDAHNFFQWCEAIERLFKEN